MKLIEYISSNNGSATQIAKKAGVAPSTVYRIAKGERFTSRATAEAISAACDGHVSVQEVCGFSA